MTSLLSALDRISIMRIEMWIFQFPSAGIPQFGQNWPSLVLKLVPLPSRTNASGSKLPCLLNHSSVLLESRGDPAAGSCFWRKNTLSVSLFQRAPIEAVVNQRAFSFQAFLQLWPFYGLFACFCVASFMRTTKSLQIKQKFHAIRCIRSLSAGQTKKVLIEFLNHRLREAG